MGFFDKLKEAVTSVTDQMKIGSAPMEPVLKENRQMLEAELKLSFESAQGIQAIKDYAQEETPGLKGALISISGALNAIEEDRKNLVKRIRFGFVRLRYSDLILKELLSPLARNEIGTYA